MTEKEALSIIEQVAAAYPRFDLTGSLGEKRIEIWLKQLIKMPYEPVLQRLMHHIAKSGYMPAIADISVFDKAENRHLGKMKQWEQEVAAQKQSGDFKTAEDFLAPDIKAMFARLKEQKANGRTC
ncbi:hypothetical protein A374_08914 [Fictibacillus macauensis ZFHKF-1]|uniref:Uncharacterized protein n=1 Tax=Fictibacillus macauensis ZFHKF-1 TaxID=1196324 RepID=I8AK73_9BACL|nr:replicative helicase loader/inhibitor [Fictibacillus macauensis]EIT85944.1 hypothetical protein A374_08914 [Fictibacillus macauensis ZFHKF-1]